MDLRIQSLKKTPKKILSIKMRYVLYNSVSCITEQKSSSHSLVSKQNYSPGQFNPALKEKTVTKKDRFYSDPFLSHSTIIDSSQKMRYTGKH